MRRFARNAASGSGSNTTTAAAGVAAAAEGGGTTVLPARGPSNSAILAAVTSATGNSTGDVKSSNKYTDGARAMTTTTTPTATTLLRSSGVATSAAASAAHVSGGMLGCVKQRILRDMIDAVPGQYKLLVCDAAAATLLSTCLRMHELMDHGVVLVEDLMLPRQPVINSPVLYFVAPEAASLQRICDDWATRDVYKQAHIFVTSTLPDALLRVLASSPRLLERVATLRDMRIDFAAPERLFFHLDMRAVTLSSFFPAAIALAGGRANVLDVATQRLVSALYTLGSCGGGSGSTGGASSSGGGAVLLPIIRYQASSRLAQHVARGVLDELARLTRDAPARGAALSTSVFASSGGGGGGGGYGDAQRPLLILVDRSFDALEPLLHERTYQCLLDDLMPLSSNNLYEQTYVGRNGEQTTRACPIDEEDEYWCAYRHRFFAVCLEELARLLRELLARNPTLAHGMSRGAGGALRLQELGNAVRALPEFQAKEAKLSMHTDICAKVMDRYKQQRLAEVCEVEQDIAAERKPFRDNLDQVRRLVADATLPGSVRLRLLLLLCAASNTREFSEGKRQQLLQSSGVAAEAQRRCANLDVVVARTGLLRQRDSPSNPLDMAVGGKHKRTTSGGSGGGGGGGRSSNSDANSSGGDHSDGTKSAGNSCTASPTLTSAEATGGHGGATPDPYRSQAYLVLEAAVRGVLSAADFPYLNGSAVDTFTTAAAAGGAGRGGAASPPPPATTTTRRTLRMGLARLQGGAAGALSSPSGAASAATVATLDLGHEGQVGLQSTQRVLLFILGGATYGEARAAYEVSRQYHRECLVGATSPLRPEDYVTQLATLQ